MGWMLPAKPVLKVSGVFFYRDVRMAGGSRVIFLGGSDGNVPLSFVQSS